MSRSARWLALLAASWQRRNPEYMPIEQQPMSSSSARALAPAPNQMAALLAYSLISASMLLVNKTVLRAVPLPALVSVLQFGVSAAFCLLLKASGRVAVDGFEWAKVKPYCVYVCLFAGSIYTNMRALELANVETVIVFRSALPLLVSLLEVAFLGRELPSRRSTVALALLAAGAAAYMYTDKDWRAGGQAYGWALAYFCVLSIEMCWGKHIVGPHLGLKSMWGPVLYTNTLSVPLMLGVAITTGEPPRLAEVTWPASTTLLLLLSCVLGLAISYFGFVARRAVTATCFTVVGVLNKLLTVVG